MLTEKLVTYALGRGVEYSDMPAVRKIVHDAAQTRLPFFVYRARHRESAPFEMKEKDGDESRQAQKDSIQLRRPA